MRRNKDNQAGASWVELLILVAILLIIASWLVRVWYGKAWLAAEYSLVGSVGISRNIYDAGKVAFLCVAGLGYLIYRCATSQQHQR